MKLDVLIGTYNRIELIRKCLDALVGKIRCEHEIIVIDAGSNDGTLEYLESMDGVSLVRQGRLLGQAKSLNQVIHSLKSDYLCWLSDDNVVKPGSLDLAVHILENNPDIGMVALKVKDVTGPHVNIPYLGSIWSSGVLNCNQGMLSTRLMQNLGGFDEQFRDYGIDADLTTRVLLSGYKVVYTKQIAVSHYRNHEADSWTDSDGRKRHLEEARSLYNRKFSLLVQPADSMNDSSGLTLEKLNPLYALFAFNPIENGKINARLVDREFSLADWIASVAHDIRNIRKGRFISKIDLLECVFKPFYLVQQIPEEVRSKIK